MILQSALQCLLVLSPSWEAFEGTLLRFEREDTASAWRPVGSPIPVTLGKNGMTQDKWEGDGKSPAGIFLLGPLFGSRAYQSLNPSFPYLLIDEHCEWVDDPASQFYNQPVDSRTPKRDWKSSEKMLEVGELYHLGCFVRYNADPVIPKRGSCIFFHIWRPGSGTAGCTAMAESHLTEVLSWLDAHKRPCLVQVPRFAYDPKWALLRP